MWIRIQRFDDEKLKISVKNSYLKKTELATYLSVNPPSEGRPRYKRSFQPSEENTQHFKTIHFFTLFFLLWIICAHLDLNLETLSPKPVKINADPVPGSQHCLSLPFSILHRTYLPGMVHFYITNTFALYCSYELNSSLSLQNIERVKEILDLVLDAGARPTLDHVKIAIFR